VALEITLFGPVGRNLPPPVTGHSVNVIGVFVSPNQIASLVLVALVAGGLAAFFRFTDFGLSVVAAAQDQEALRFLGIPLARASMFTWGLAAVLSALAALLIQPDIGVISPGAYSGIFIRALSAALIGGLSSMRGAFLGGVIVGVGEAAIRHATVGTSLTGLPELCIFAAVVLTLVFRPQGVFGSR
jgi:branched-chain amino acid transport system permease protein